MTKDQGRLKVGRRISDNKPFSLPIEIAGQAVSIFGIREGGKSNTAGRIVEELLSLNRQVLIIDPTDAHWGLRSSADGKRDGFPIYVIGGEHGDIPLRPNDGRQIAELVAKENISLIVSVRHLKRGDQRNFVADLCEELYHLKGKIRYRTPLTVVIDEAPVFIPQKPQTTRDGGPIIRCTMAIEDMVARGRNSGLGVFLVSQRFATLNNDVRALCDTLVVHRITGPHDRRALKDWIDDNASIDDQRAVLSTLATLQKGQAWVWAPRAGVMEHVQFDLRQTFDSSKTPETSKRYQPPKKLAAVDLEALRGKMDAAIEERRSNDVDELKATVARLRKELQAAAGATDPEEIARAEARGRAAALSAVQSLHREINRTASDIEKLVTGIGDRYGTLAASLRSMEVLISGAHQASEAASNGHTRPKRTAPAAPEPDDRAAVIPTSPKGSPKDRVLQALAWWSAAGVEEPSRVQVAFVAGYSVGGTFNRLVGEMRTAGLIEYPAGNCLRATSAAHLEAVEGNVTRGALIDRVRAILAKNGSMTKIFDALVRFDREVTREDLAEASGYTIGGTFNRLVGRMKTLGIVHYPSGGMVSLSSVFDGLPV